MAPPWPCAVHHLHVCCRPVRKAPPRNPSLWRSRGGWVWGCGGVLCFENMQLEVKYQQGVRRTTTPLSPLIREWTARLWAQRLEIATISHQHIIRPMGKLIWATWQIPYNCTTTCLDNSTDLQIAKIHPTVYEIWILTHGKAHIMAQMV